jgi:hypothetical protein
MSICPRCGAEFGCGMVDPTAPDPCWCMSLPRLLAVPPGSDASCFCPACLRDFIAQSTPPAVT